MSFLDPATILAATGYLGLFVAIFAETGLLIGIVLPGDSLLFVAGFLASGKHLHILLVIPIAFIAAVLGDSTSYALGKKYGPAIFNKKDSFFFNKKYVSQAEVFYKKHGGKAVVFARFMPVIRTIAPILAGIGDMKYNLFVVYNIIGAAIWALVMSLFGYFLGMKVTNADHYIFPIVIALIVASIIPGVVKLIAIKFEKKK